MMFRTVGSTPRAIWPRDGRGCMSPQRLTALSEPILSYPIGATPRPLGADFFRKPISVDFLGEKLHQKLSWSRLDNEAAFPTRLSGDRVGAFHGYRE